ncbi:hypothetical protein RJ639_039506 [Escallonia herrerae]|uniref:DUF2415 domain-containing protein n=1 Tax=Escallonia herrerae TaxID=1293975 RepID=A0AA89BER4_9ASTE|nr:hypothetical protein RJ639_039506 [Escallonia herrerae]
MVICGVRGRLIALPSLICPYCSQCGFPTWINVVVHVVGSRLSEVKAQSMGKAKVAIIVEGLAKPKLKIKRPKPKGRPPKMQKDKLPFLRPITAAAHQLPLPPPTPFALIRGLVTSCRTSHHFWKVNLLINMSVALSQLRNLVWATSKHDVYLMSHFSVIHWSSLTGNKNILEVYWKDFHRLVSTLAVKEKLLVAGGFQGELICKNLDRPGVWFCSRTTYDDNAITNAIDIYNTARDFDMEKFQLSKHFRYPWPVNHTSLSLDGKLIIIVGDNPDGMLVDSQTGKTVAPLSGHLDFSFASAWNPDGLTFATGNQDKTCRIWDVRNLSKSVAALKGNLGAIRSIRYTSDERFVAMAEPADFVHVFDVKNEYEKEQEIDFFGEISGISFSPDTESLFIGVWDRTYGSLLEFGRR